MHLDRVPKVHHCRAVEIDCSIEITLLQRLWINNRKCTIRAVFSQMIDHCIMRNELSIVEWTDFGKQCYRDSLRTMVLQNLR